MPPLPDSSAQGTLPANPSDHVRDSAGHVSGPEIDTSPPQYGYHTTPMVGIGGSAGSLPALQQFFRAMPADSGFVFVVIVHLSATHESALDEVLGRTTSMPVTKAIDGQKVEPNRVYVIPPGKHLSAVDGHLRLENLDPEKGRRIAVDLFFRSLADSHGPHAAAIVLSGADSDGALGVKRIKERGGLTIAQDLAEAAYSSMPRAAINTGMVDWILQTSEMPERLLRYVEQKTVLKLPPEEGEQPALAAQPTVSEDETALREVLVHLRTRTGRDFSYYKRATIVRRIGRRMQVNAVPDMPAYLIFLRTHPGEAGALLQDLLISVTNFFRDPDAFRELEKHIALLFRNKGPNDSIRVWVPACATGEEAYSIGILLLEYARRHDSSPTLQVFACDLDEDAIRQARAGAYPATIAADVSEERLSNFFYSDHAGYRVCRELREMVLFAVHDLLKDAPFSRMDLISCRNLLIYLNRDAQNRVFETFHFALRNDGLLFLGTSEAIPDGSPLFRVIDKTYRIYGHEHVSRTSVPVPTGPSTLQRSLELQERSNAETVIHGRNFPPIPGIPYTRPPNGPDRARIAEMHFKLIERLAPPSLVVDENHVIMHLSESAGRFLKYTGGHPTNDLLRVADPAIRSHLRAALFRAMDAKDPVRVNSVPVDLGTAPGFVDIVVTPADDIAPGYRLITFIARQGAAGPSDPPAESGPPEPVVRQLERELEHLKSLLSATVEQHTASSDEMKAGNEELQATNEELRSASEELETSREELQSINEELTTVNAELKANLDELAHANSDLQNLMASTAIPTVFLDRSLALSRYTPNAADLFYLIPSDVHRPLAHVKQRVQYPEIVADAERVLRTLVPSEREVRTEDQWFLARLQPYRTLEDHIAGVVITFVNLTERKRFDEALRQSEERLRTLSDAVPQLIWTSDSEGSSRYFNRRWYDYTGLTSEQSLGLGWKAVIHPDDAAGANKKWGQAFSTGTVFDVEFRLRRADGMHRWFIGRSIPFRNPQGVISSWFGSATDIQALKDAQAELTAREEHFRRAIEDAPIPMIMHAEDGQVLQISRTWTELTGFAKEEIPTFDAWLNHAYGFGAEGLRGMMQRIFSGKAERQRLDFQITTRNGERREWTLTTSAPGVLQDGRRFAVGMVIDFTEQRRAEQSLRESEERLRTADGRKNQFLAMLGHELRNPLAAIRGGLAILQSEKSRPETRVATLPIVSAQVAHMERLIDDLLDVTRIVEGKLKVRRERVTVQQTLGSALEMVRGVAEERKFDIQVTMPGEPLILDADPVRMTQVFVNILTNALNYAGDGRRIDVAAAKDPEGAKVSIRDYGPGIPPDLLPRIFEPFVQSRSTVTMEGGLGLGLAVVRELVSLHGGHVDVFNLNGQPGCEFVIHLPLAAESP